MRIGIDIGGTFTDFVALDEQGRMRLHKTLSTPHDPIAAIETGLAALGAPDAEIVHGTTIVTNSILERKGARVLLIVNEGFEDVLAIGRQTRASLYDLTPKRQVPWIERRDVIGIQARIGADQTRAAAISEKELAKLQHLAGDYEAVAISLLFSFLDASDEQRIAKVMPEGVFVSASHQVAPTIGEFERTATTFLNAFVGPRAHAYLSALQRRIAPRRLAIMHSAGGLISAEEAARRPVALALSGPAGGLVAAARLGEALGEPKLLSFDMGGTSTDVAAIDGTPELAPQGEIAGMPIALPMLAIHTIGAGGGSIAWIDEAGLPRVGPASAGADPGPVCYARGGQTPTITDADCVLGRLPAAVRLAGGMELARDAAEGELARFGARLGLDAKEAALAVVRLAEEAMAGALRVVSIEQGRDPRGYALVCFGGAGGMHALPVAEHLGMRKVILPVAAGAFSALGMLAARPRVELARSLLVRLDRPEADRLIEQAASVLREEARQRLPEGKAQQIDVHLRYLGQGDALVLRWQGSVRKLEEAFHAAHRRSFGYALSRPVEVVAVRLASIAPAPPLALAELPAAERAPKVLAQAESYEAGKGPVIERASLRPGHEIEGPAWIVEDTATFWLAPGWALGVSREGHLIAERKR